MDWNMIFGSWTQLKDRFQKRWDKLTDGDLNFIQGRRDLLVHKLQERYSYTKDAAEHEADEFVATFGGKQERKAA